MANNKYQCPKCKTDYIELLPNGPDEADKADYVPACECRDDGNDDNDALKSE